MTQKVFVSHSRRDEDLVRQIKDSLDILEFDTVVYEDEDVPDFRQDDHEIINRIRDSDFCFVFPTESVRRSEITSAWLIAESAIARAFGIPTVIFKEEGDDYGVNFPYSHGLVIYEEGRLPIEVQKQVKALVANQRTGHPAVRDLVSHGEGAPSEDVLIGAITKVSGDPEKEKVETPVQCHACEQKFVYWGLNQRFTCLHCHQELDRDDASIADGNIGRDLQESERQEE